MTTAIDLKVSIETRGDDVVITPVGELDLYTSPKLREEILAVAEVAARRDQPQAESQRRASIH